MGKQAKSPRPLATGPRSALGIRAAWSRTGRSQSVRRTVLPRRAMQAVVATAFTVGRRRRGRVGPVVRRAGCWPLLMLRQERAFAAPCRPLIVAGNHLRWSRSRDEHAARRRTLLRVPALGRHRHRRSWNGCARYSSGVPAGRAAARPFSRSSRCRKEPSRRCRGRVGA
jgi:hypothetical protein